MSTGEEWDEPWLASVAAARPVGRVLELQVVTCGPATKALNEAFVNHPATVPAWGWGEDSVGVNAVVFFPKSPLKLSLWLMALRNNKTSLLEESKEVRFLAEVTMNKEAMSSCDGVGV